MPEGPAPCSNHGQGVVRQVREETGKGRKAGRGEGTKERTGQEMRALGGAALRGLHAPGNSVYGDPLLPFQNLPIFSSFMHAGCEKPGSGGVSAQWTLSCYVPASEPSGFASWLPHVLTFYDCTRCPLILHFIPPSSCCLHVAA